MVTGLTPLWDAYDRIEAYWRDVYYAASFMWSGADEWNANMREIKRRIEELAPSGRLGMQVVNGTLSPDNWKNVHHALWDGISGQARINNGSASVWSDFIVPAWTDVTDYAKEAKDKVGAAGEKLDFLTSPVGLLLVFGILLMLVVWKIA